MRTTWVGIDIETVIADSIAVISAFRDHCLRSGYTESLRASLRGGKNDTIRFTNSSISVLGAQCNYEDTPQLFLFQPALRLHNQVYVRKTGRMSPFGCYFIAFGTVSPPSRVQQAFDQFESFFIDALCLPPERLVLRGTAEDMDLCTLLRGSRVATEIDGCDRRFFRHTFGIGGTVGRNVNMSIVSRSMLYDVANFIVMEREGEPWALETAFGVNNIVTRMDQLEHPVLATSAARLTGAEGAELIQMDALSSAIALTMEGFTPQARGREGNYRQFVAQLVPLWREDPNGTISAVQASAKAEAAIRAHISPAANGVHELSPAEATQRLLSHVQHLASRGSGTDMPGGCP